jgi:outer membrane protein assembly factor BamB
MILYRRFISALGLLALLSATGCSTLGLSNEPAPQAKPDAAKRVAVLRERKQLQPDAGVKGREWIKLPQVVENTAWPQPQGNAQNLQEHAALRTEPLQRLWRSSIGDGSGDALRLLARPVVAADKIFTMDASGHVAAFAIESGDKLWRISTAPEDAGDAIGGGITFADGQIFAATGHGEVLALSSEDGKILWRRKLDHPLRAAPTAANERVFVIDVNNGTTALNAKDGAVLWTHNGLPKMASLLGAASPAISGDNVIAAYSSGEIFALRTQNGQPAWSENLVTSLAESGMPEMTDIRGAPVIDKGGVFAVSHSGRMTAIVLRSGERGWELEAGGSSTPVILGNVVYLVTNTQQLLAIRRDNGKIIWITELPRLADAEDRDSERLQWTGPLLAGDTLFVTGSNGALVAYDAYDGSKRNEYELPAASFITPVIARKTLFALSENGALTAWR